MYYVSWREHPNGQAAAVSIIKAAGPNQGGSFTAKPGEETITLQAQVTPLNLASAVTWKIEEDPSHYPHSPLPSTDPQGADASFPVHKLGPGRWPTDHAASLELEPKQLSYKVTANVTDGQGHVTESETKKVTQDEIDTAREEYIELGVGPRVPAYGEFRAHAYNKGDYMVPVVNEAFDAHFSMLIEAWSGPRQVNDMYRNPVHNRYHLGPGETPDPNSWHQYGCAADLQTFPSNRDSQTAKAEASFYWKRLDHLAESRHFTVEPMRASGVGHVHVQQDRH